MTAVRPSVPAPEPRPCQSPCDPRPVASRQAFPPRHRNHPRRAVRPAQPSRRAFRPRGAPLRSRDPPTRLAFPQPCACRNPMRRGRCLPLPRRFRPAPSLRNLRTAHRPPPERRYPLPEPPRELPPSAAGSAPDYASPSRASCGGAPPSGPAAPRGGGQRVPPPSACGGRRSAPGSPAPSDESIPLFWKTHPTA